MHITLLSSLVLVGQVYGASVQIFPPPPTLPCPPRFITYSQTSTYVCSVTQKAIHVSKDPLIVYACIEVRLYCHLLVPTLLASVVASKLCGYLALLVSETER